MYIRPSHRPQSAADVVEVIERNRFATLVTQADDAGLIATHLPFVYDPARGEHGTLYAHMARANGHGRIVAEAESLVIFAGPHAYISPSWYDDRATAPTWDYVAVHCYGTAALHGRDAAQRNIARLVEVMERDRPDAWSMADLGPAEVERLIANVVSFEIPVTRIEAKFKLDQGETPERKRAATAALERAGETAIAGYRRRY